MFDKGFSQNDQSLHADLQTEKFLHIYSEQHKEESLGGKGRKISVILKFRDKHYSLII